MIQDHAITAVCGAAAASIIWYAMVNADDRDFDLVRASSMECVISGTDQANRFVWTCNDGVFMTSSRNFDDAY